MALLTTDERELKLRLRAAAHTQQVRLDDEAKRLLNNATANISPLYKKLSALLDERGTLDNMLVSLTCDSYTFEAFANKLAIEDLVAENTKAVKKLLPTLTKHLKRRYALHPLFLDAMKDDPLRVAIFKELLSLAPLDILKEYI